MTSIKKVIYYAPYKEQLHNEQIVNVVSISHAHLPKENLHATPTKNQHYNFPYVGEIMLNELFGVFYPRKLIFMVENMDYMDDILILFSVNKLR